MADSKLARKREERDRKLAEKERERRQHEQLIQESNKNAKFGVNTPRIHQVKLLNFILFIFFILENVAVVAFLNGCC